MDQCTSRSAVGVRILMEVGDMRSRRVLVCFFVSMSVSALALAAAGDLDATFDVDGIVLADFGPGSNTLGFDAVIQSTGKIVVAGQYFDADGDQIALARFTSAGVLDTAFGTAAGWTIVSFGYPQIYATAAAEQPDGKIVVTGTLNDGTRLFFFVARFTADGQVDTQFGNVGITLIDFGALGRSTDLAIDADGKIVIVGFVVLQGTNQNFGLTRVDKKGKIDKSFGKHGLVETDFHGFDDFVVTVAIQPDGKIVAGGTVRTALSYGAMGLARYTSKGDPDLSFGSGGRVTTDFGSANDDFGNSVLLQADGRIVLGGFAQPTFGVFTFVRYNTSGTIHLSHTEDYPGTAADFAYGLAIAPNGRIILGGRVIPDTSSLASSFAVSCFDGTTGLLDATFGVLGWTITDIGPDYENISNLRLQSDNKIVAVGYSLEGDGRYHLVLTRYIGCG
jgi:uncharacterized delta-60 repeat protein